MQAGEQMAESHPVVLRDPEAQAQLVDQGWVKVPFLSAEETVSLLKAQASLQSPGDTGLVIDCNLDERDVMAETMQLTVPIWEAHLEKTFVDHEPVISTFVVKHPGESSRMLLHCEPAYTYGAPNFNIWIPLVDVGPEADNGVLYLVPGSQRLQLGLLGFNSPMRFRPYQGVIEDNSLALDVAAGEAVIYDSRTLHWSAANRSSVPRPALASAIAPKGHDLIHVVATGRRSRRIYQVDRQFFVDFQPFEVAQRIGERYQVIKVEEDNAELSASDVQDLLGLVEVPHPVVLTPAGLIAQLLPTRCVSGAILPEHDVDLSAKEISVVDTDLAGSVGSSDVIKAVDAGEGKHHSVVEAHGEVAVLASAEHLPAELGAGLLSLVEPGRELGLVLVVDANGEVTLDSGHGLTLVAYDCPQVNAGVLCGEAAAALEPGVSIEIPAGARCRIWNGGPGSAWLVASRPAPTVADTPSVAADARTDTDTAAVSKPPKWKRLLSRLRP